MFNVRPFKIEDATACGECFYESFIKCDITSKDKTFLKDYFVVLFQKINFAYVAETEDKKVVGFIAGYYNKKRHRDLYKKKDLSPEYGKWIKIFIKYYFGLYGLSKKFKKELMAFFKQTANREQRDFDLCDVEIIALASKKDYRKGVGTALLNKFIERCIEDKVDCIRVFTDTLVTYTFYEKRGFKCIKEKPYKKIPNHRYFIYELKISDIKKA